MPATDTCEVILLVQPEDRDAHLPDCIEPLRALLPTGADLKIVDGGATRQDSMERGLTATATDCDLIIVHDAARALVSVEQTRECLTTAARVGAELDPCARDGGPKASRSRRAGPIALAALPPSYGAGRRSVCPCTSPRAEDSSAGPTPSRDD